MAIGTGLALAGLAIAGGSSIASSAIKSHAAGSAADKQQAGADKATQLAQDSAATSSDTVDAATTKANDQLAGLPDEIKQLLAPYMDLGTTGTVGLKDILSGGDLSKQFSFNPNDLQNTPGYQFTLSQGMQAIQRAASAQGKSLGGGTLKSLEKYGAGLASTTYGDEFNRAMQTFTTNRDTTKLKLGSLLDATNIGAKATGGLADTTEKSTYAQAGNTLDAGKYRANAFTHAADVAAGNTIGSANAQATATATSGNAWGNGIADIGNSVGSYFSLKDIMTPKVSSGLPAGQVPYTPSYYELYGKATP